ncbi:MAG TPA: GNAT family N-acetyltransferase [Candidatus Acidoferrales bacterium]|nr:GNAT family N-acetyltransferase [Candidatus Acidoferrales bacterium]
MSVYKIAPLHDPRWENFLGSELHASIFHTTGWLEALRRTYGYEPIVYTTSPPSSELRNGVVFCQVESWLTGRRLVSLPFSDHCEPLVDDPQELPLILGALREGRERPQTWDYIEIRPLHHRDLKTSFHESTYDYAVHRLDLSPSLSQLFGNLHKDSTQRKIRRAEREGLRYEDGRSESLLSIFYRLLIPTRRRIGVPPQPLQWFRNLIECLGEALHIRVAFQGSRPIAAILTLRYKDTLLYKYGCSDARLHNLGGMQLLLWRSIEEAKCAGLRTFDFGRSDCDNAGLILFKERWGAIRSTLIYSRYTTSVKSRDNYKPREAQWKLRIAKRLLSHAPGKVLSMVGDALYKHIG